MSNDKKTTSQPVHQVPEKKQTTLGLYVTAQEAYEMWKAEPETINIIDVRIPEEYIFVGHAEMAKNIPLLFVKYQWNTETDRPQADFNPEFITSVESQFSIHDMIFLICRSGGRSAWAANMLIEAGFTNVYNIIDGFEGDKVDDPDSAYHGKRMKNGWKNFGLPWTYETDLEQLWISET